MAKRPEQIKYKVSDGENKKCFFYDNQNRDIRPGRRDGNKDSDYEQNIDNKQNRFVKPLAVRVNEKDSKPEKCIGADED